MTTTTKHKKVEKACVKCGKVRPVEVRKENMPTMCRACSVKQWGKWSVKWE